MFNLILEKIVSRRDLNEDEADEVAREFFDGKLSEIQMASLLAALRAKGEKRQEIVAFARQSMIRMNKVNINGAILDTAGTGGDFSNTLNASTAAAIIASCRVGVAKHGNRAISGKIGSADVLELLGYNINISAEKAVEAFNKSNFVFLFAPNYHPEFRIASKVRKEMGIRTIFNFLGPIVNPANVKRHLIGVSNVDLAEELSLGAIDLGKDKVIIVNGYPNIDEVSPSGKTVVIEVSRSGIDKYFIEPKELGISEISINEIKIEDKNLGVIRFLRGLKGQEKSSKTFFALNAGFALYTSGYTKDIKDGVEEASNIIDEGEAIEKLKNAVKASGGEFKVKTDG